jgi:heat shock protein HslJ
MRRRTLLPILAALALVAAACTSSSAGGNGGTLEGVTWQLKTYSNGTSLVNIPPGVASDAVFAAGQVSGVLVCNSYTGTYATIGASIKISGIAATLMACPDTSAGVEGAIVAALGNASTYTATRTNLTMFDANGGTLLQYGAAPADALAGTSWNVTGINNGKQAVVSLAAGTTVTLVFGTDGSVSGNGGCNTYNGSVAVNGDAISFGPLMSTQMACPQPVMDQETQFFAALAAASTFNIGGSTLTMRDSGGATQVTGAKQ